MAGLDPAISRQREAGRADGRGPRIKSGDDVGYARGSRSRGTCQTADGGDVVERQRDAGDRLPVLVPLAGHRQHVAGAQHLEPGGDRAGAVADLDGVGAGGQDGGADRRRVFAAGVVVGDDRARRPDAGPRRPSAGACRGRGRRRRRTPGPTSRPYAAAGPAAGAPTRPACARSRHRRRRRSPRPRAPCARARRKARAACASGSATPHAAARPAATSALSAWNRPGSGRSITRPPSKVSTWPPGRGTARSRRITSPYSPTRCSTQATRPGDAGKRFQRDRIERGAGDRGGAGRQQVVEQPQLGQPIGLERAVVVEVVARQVGEAGRREPHAVQPELVEPVRRGLQGRRLHPVARQPGQRVREGHRVRRGQAGFAAAVRTDHAERAEAGAAPAGSRKNLAQEVGGAGLAVGAGDGDDRARLAARLAALPAGPARAAARGRRSAAGPARRRATWSRSVPARPPPRAPPRRR